MDERVVVIPSSALIMLGNLPLVVDMAALNPPEALRALHWHKGKGHCEWTNGQQNTPLQGDADYRQHVLPFVHLWQNAKKNLDESKKPTDEEILAQHKRAMLLSINQTYLEALAFILDENTAGDAHTAALAVLDFARDDPDGLDFIRNLLHVQKNNLIAKVEMAASLRELQAIKITWTV